MHRTVRARAFRAEAVPVLVAVVVVLSAAVGLLTPWASTRAGVVFDDVGELLVSAGAAVAAGTAGWRARRSRSRQTLTWWWLAGGCASWAAGQAVWSWYEVLRNVTTPFPSLADVGFLLFPVAACVALLLYPAEGSAPQHTRRVLDALMTTSSVALVAWQTTLSAIVHAGGGSSFALVVSLAYPVSDVAVLVLAVLTVSRGRGRRTGLWLVAAGVVALAVSDSGFAYLAASRNYSGGAVDLGWFLGFVLIALAATLTRADDQTAGSTEGTARSQAGDRAWAAPSAAGQSTGYLPYVPVVLALTTTLGWEVAGRSPALGPLLLEAAVVVLLLARQGLALRENTQLTSRLAVREAELHHQAFHDGLTGLANRALFQDRLEHALDLHARDLRPIAVLFLDLDDFKVINDTLGHSAGDELLQRVADRLLGAVRHGDTVARLGGDEFAVLLEDGSDATAVAGKMLEALQAPFPLGPQRTRISASLGVFALHSEDLPLSASDLLAHADTAMYSAKRAGKGQIAVCRPGMTLLEMTDRPLAQSLRTALREGAVHLAFQPVVDLTEGTVVGLEALARWTHECQPIPPDVFVALASRHGLLHALTDSVLEQACQQLSDWTLTAGLPPVWVAVNVSPAQLAAPDFASGLLDRLARHALTPDQLVVEITETDTFADDTAGQDAITRLRQAGLRASMDDFGTGFASLAQLARLPIDIVKIDRTFLTHLETDARQAAFLPALLHLAHDLNLEVIAEGIERPTQLAELRRLGYPLGQGYLLHKPLTPQQATHLLHNHPTAAAATETVTTTP